jgi:hypothetical protein
MHYIVEYYAKMTEEGREIIKELYDQPKRERQVTIILVYQQ